MRIVLLVSAFNGLTQRVWCALREAGHTVGVQLATGPQDMIDGIRRTRPDLILCPFLKDRVPTEVWRHWRTVIIHPGPVGDRGPSSLDWAITESAPTWGVTALQAVEELDAGPVWATRTFGMPAAAPRKSALYAGPVADAALECVLEVVAKAGDPGFRPTEPGVAGPRPAMKQADRAFDWSDPADLIVRRIRAADGSPGARTRVAGRDVYAYDAHPGLTRGARPGAVLGRRQGAVLVATGDGSVWLGHLRDAGAPGGIKLPATTLLGRQLRGVPQSPLPAGTDIPRVNEVLHTVGQEAFADAELRSLLLDEPSVMGVESLQVDQLSMRMVARTLPGKQFDVGRILRARASTALRNDGHLVGAGLDTAEPSGRP